MYAAAQAAQLPPRPAALPSETKVVPPGMGLNQRSMPSDVANRPIGRAVHCNSRPISTASGRGSTGNSQPISGPAGRHFTGNSRTFSWAADREVTGNSRPISGRSHASSRPISALLNGSKELADLVSVSNPRYTEQSAAPSLEPSAEILHGEYGHVAPA